VTQAVFVDTDVVLDLLACREPFYPAAARLFIMVERGELSACVSSLSFANLYYLLRKELGSRRAVDVLRKLRLLVTVLPVDDSVIEQALSAGFRDFEDAIQYFSALAGNAACLITRNARDYPEPAIKVCTAEEFLAQLPGCPTSRTE
jgi:predicted nucleic acid-binding protein